MTGSTRRARQEEAAKHSEAQRLSTLNQVRTRFDDQASSLQSSLGVSSEDDNDADDVQYQGPDLRPVDWTVVWGPDGRFARAGPSSSGVSERAGHSLVDNEPLWGSRRSQSAGIYLWTLKNFEFTIGLKISYLYSNLTE